MTKKRASDSGVAFTLYYTFGLFSWIPALIVTWIASKFATDAISYIFLYSLPFLPISYFALKYATTSVNKNYIITNKDIISSLLLKYLLLLGGLVMGLSAYLTGYISAGWIAAALGIIFTATVMYKFAPGLIQESTREEVHSSVNSTPEPHLLKRTGQTALLTMLGFVIFVIIPLIGVLFFGEQLGQTAWLVLIAYYVIGIFLFGKFVSRK